MKQRTVRCGDWIILAAILLLAGGLALFLFFGGQGKTYCVIRQSRAIIKVLPMDMDTAFVVVGRYENTVEIQDHQVRVVHSTCPNGICAASGSIDKAGQSIICLPNEVVVELVQDVPAEVDVVAK